MNMESLNLSEDCVEGEGHDDNDHCRRLNEYRHDSFLSLFGSAFSDKVEDTENTEELEFAGEDDGGITEQPLSALCGCPCQPNRFNLSFQDTRHLGDICLDESRVKCNAFWNFVDSNAQYSKLIKEGRFSQSRPRLPRYSACDGIEHVPCSTNTTKACISTSQEVRNAAALPMEIKYRSEAERRRFQNRRNAVLELQLKSGQPIIHAKRKILPNCFRDVYADEVKESKPLQFL